MYIYIYIYIYISKKCFADSHVNLLLIVKENAKHYVFIKDLNRFMYDHTPHHGIKYLFFAAFSAQKKYESVMLKIPLKNKFKMRHIHTNIENMLLVVMVIN